jgi:predicted transcriptional regulator
MAKRITIMIDDDIDKKLRLIQAKQISKTQSSVSYSSVINEVLRRQLK